MDFYIMICLFYLYFCHRYKNYVVTNNKTGEMKIKNIKSGIKSWNRLLYFQNSA